MNSKQQKTINPSVNNYLTNLTKVRDFISDNFIKLDENSLSSVIIEYTDNDDPRAGSTIDQFYEIYNKNSSTKILATYIFIENNKSNNDEMLISSLRDKINECGFLPMSKEITSNCIIIEIN